MRIFNKIKILKALSSLKITVLTLGMLFVLTFWGTVAQVDIGLYQAQVKFFYSWFFLGFGFLPLPGAQFVLTLMFVNLLSVTLTRFTFTKRNIGILTIHFGLYLYFISAFVTFHLSQEYNLTMAEGESSNLASSYYQWELSSWTESQGERRDVIAYDIEKLKTNQNLSFDEYGVDLVVKNYYPNSKASKVVLNDSKAMVFDALGINYLEKTSLEKQPELNLPGIELTVQKSKESERVLFLWAGENRPTSLVVKDKTYYFQLRRKRFELPFVVNLKDFIMEKHPGTEMARTYESMISVDHKNLKRDVRVYMNHPFRYKDLSFFQASYSIDEKGVERSTLAVVKNKGRLLPYWATGVTFLGMVIHFLGIGRRRKKKK